MVDESSACEKMTFKSIVNSGIDLEQLRMDRATPPYDGLVLACMSSYVDKETIIQLVEAAKAAEAEHDLLRRKRNLRFAQEADQRWRQRYLRLRKTQLQPCLQQWISQTATKVHTSWKQLIGDDRRRLVRG